MKKGVKRETYSQTQDRREEKYEIIKFCDSLL